MFSLSLSSSHQSVEKPGNCKKAAILRLLFILIVLVKPYEFMKHIHWRNLQVIDLKLTLGRGGYRDIYNVTLIICHYSCSAVLHTLHVTQSSGGLYFGCKPVPYCLTFEFLNIQLTQYSGSFTPHAVPTIWQSVRVRRVPRSEIFL